MQKRVDGQSSFNVNELLASAGVSNHRVNKGAKPGEELTEFLTSDGAQSAAQKTMQVNSIIDSARQKVQELAEKKEKKGRIMVGKAGFEMPSPEKLKSTTQRHQQEKTRKLVSSVAHNQETLEGKMTLNAYTSKINHQKINEVDPVKQYVQNFSDARHNMRNDDGRKSTKAAEDFGSALQAQVISNIRNVTEAEEKNARNFAKIRQNRLQEEKSTIGQNQLAQEMKEIEKRERRPNTLNATLEEESMLLTYIGHQFNDKIRFMKQVSQREVERVGSSIDKKDPKIAYFMQCQQDLDLCLPILEKIYRKTLVLQEYTLSPGHCRGLAQACRLFDHQMVNRVLFSNCGIDDQEFSEILKGLNYLKDFKSIIYKMNTFGDLSLANLRPLMHKRIPYNLNELKLIDCQMTGSHVSRLVDMLIETDCQLRNLSIVNANHTDVSFTKITNFIREAEKLEELDLSWSKLPPTSWRRLLEVLKDNKQLRVLNISHNKILEDQPKPTEEQLANGVELSARNMDMMLCFKDFVKYNCYLTSINLENTGLIEPAIRFLVAILRKSQALRCLHLCANEGINPEVVAWTRNRIKAQEGQEIRTIQPYIKMKKEMNKISKMATRIGKNLFQQENNQSLETIREEAQWQKIRDGIKLRAVINCKRMNEISTAMTDIDMEGSFLSRKLVIERNLGIKHVMPGMAQWKVLSDKKQECWRCSQHIMTIFLWSPRIGELSCIREPEKHVYYQEKMNLFEDPAQISDIPRIAASFNNWQYEEMHEVVNFCIKNDLNKPNFFKKCFEDGSVTTEDETKLAHAERLVLENTRTDYYKENWKEVLMCMMRYKKPMVANAHLLTQESLDYDPSQPVYMSLHWLKAGRHTFVISHKPKEGGAQGKNNGSLPVPGVLKKFQTTITAKTEKVVPVGSGMSLISLLKQKSKLEKAKKTQTFYVHDMLATFREEKIPFYYNPRHVKVIEKQKYVERPVFQQWQQDNDDMAKACIQHDRNFYSYIKKKLPDMKEQQLLEKVIHEHFMVIQTVYNYMRSVSITFPFVEVSKLRKYFFRKSNIHSEFNVQEFEYDIIIKQMSFAFDQNDERPFQPMKTLNRHQMIDLFAILANYTFIDSNFQRTTVQKWFHGQAPVERMTLAQAFSKVCTHVLQPFIEDNNISWNDFRSERLWCSPVKLLYTMNENGLRKLFSYGIQASITSGKKNFKADYMTVEDCRWMFLEQKSNLEMSEIVIEQCYGLSKQTVVEETSEAHVMSYYRMVYVEFLEFLARVAECYFAGSEMEDLELANKIEYLLDEILPLVNAKLTKQETIIEEFSESDDDY